MSKRGRSLNDDEKELWRRVTARVKPRLRTLAVDSEPPPAAPRPPSARPRPSAPPANQPSPRPAASPAPQNRGAEKRVRRGKLEIAAILDLHGHNQVTGRAALGRFLHVAQMQGARTVIVVTGVGRAGQGVLKQRLPEWLAESDLRAMVSGFAPAHRKHGGEGAYYVFLRRPGTT